MNTELVGQIIDEYEQIFRLDLEEERAELEDAGIAVLNQYGDEQITACCDTGVNDEATFNLRRELLNLLAQKTRLANQIGCVLEDFQNQIDEGYNDFRLYDSSEPLDQHLLEIMYDVKGIWSNLPNRLVRENWSLIRKAAIRYHQAQKIDNELTFNDLIGAGSEALVKASMKMTNSTDTDFKSIAWKLLKKAIRKEQNKKGLLPQKVRRKLQSLQFAREELEIVGSNPPDIELLAKFLQVSYDEVKGLIEIELLWHGGTEIFDDDIESLEVADLSHDALTLLIEEEKSHRISQALMMLSPLQKSIINNIYVENLSLRQTAAKMDITMNKLRKVHKKALYKLRSIFLADD